ncbi:MAG TPA: hypothetical protein VF459_13765 [Caulobacteraceae bacterium]
MAQTDQPTPPPQPWFLPVAIGLALLGAAMFAALIWRLGFGYGGAWDPRAAWLLTPVFLSPLLIWLMRSRRLGFGGATVLAVAITAIHFTAIATASFTYKAQKDDSWMHILDKTQQQWDSYRIEHEPQIVVARRTAVEGGRKAGAIGAFASFALLLPFGRAFRRPLALAGMAAVGAALTFWGGFALSQRFPEAMTPRGYALWVFLPWQGLFGITLAALFAGVAPRPSR